MQLDTQNDGAEISSLVSDLYICFIVRVTCLLRLTTLIVRHLRTLAMFYTV